MSNVWHLFVSVVKSFINSDHSNTLNNEMTNYLSNSQKLDEITESTTLSQTSTSYTAEDDDYDIFQTEFIDLTVPNSELKERRNSSFHRVKSIIIDYTDKHELEQNFMLKLDFFLLTSAILGYIIKYMNQLNVSTAYMNGMDKYYDMSKNEYNYMSTCWSIGYFIGQIFSAYFLRKFAPRVFLGTLEIIWGLLTLVMIYCEDIKYVYIIRFLVGLTESAFFPSIEYLLGSWYNPEEITKRSTLFALSSSFSRIVTGPIQNLILKWFKNGKFEPFQYLFFFDVLISIPVGIITIFFNPDTPTTTTNWYWSSSDKLVALERRRLSGALYNHVKQNQTDLARVKGFLKDWETYFFPLLFICYNNSGLNQIVMTTYLRDDLGMPAEKFNLFPSFIAALGIVVAISVGYISDFFKGTKNYLFVSINFICVAIGSYFLAFHWDSLSVPFHIFLYFIISVPGSFGQPQIFSWINRTLVDDDLKRHFIVVITNTIPYLTSAVHIVVWDTRNQPRFKAGFTYNVFLGIFGLVITYIIYRYTTSKYKRGRETRYSAITLNSVIAEEDENV
ncbi:hypothetical protein WICMUC_001549 [Wickerhamomyces mucosus]|uniref:Major facilitator superfamily (MFS) profile domain-containing protein n=1 Tax=Wickerhamomyces mucosus TaxID=1378264 RepID=A0A9P8PUS7_9ASCO|nr:hypothetical protein WICMUC_001549 [Wickerhamomyces mucosus]